MGERKVFSINGVGIFGLSWMKTDKLSKFQPKPHILYKNTLKMEHR